jgi:hypothetical protein
MSQFTLNILGSVGEAVVSTDDLSVAGLPVFTQGDSIDLKIFLLQPSGSAAAYIPTAGITLQVALGKKPSTGTYYTQQFTWNPSSDAGQPYFEAVLPMNTAAINTLLNNITSAGAWFEVKMIQGGLTSTVLSKLVTINAAVILPGVLVVPPGQTPLSAEVANATFLGRVIVGPIYLVCQTDPTKKICLECNPDGTFSADSSP